MLSGDFLRHIFLILIRFTNWKKEKNIELHFNILESYNFYSFEYAVILIVIFNFKSLLYICIQIYDINTI